MCTFIISKQAIIFSAEIRLRSYRCNNYIIIISEQWEVETMGANVSRNVRITGLVVKQRTESN